MTKSNLPLNASAVLAWLPAGQIPTESDFDPNNIQPPPSPNPEPWWELHEALRYARTVENDHGKMPWIKTGDIVLSPEEIIEAFNAMAATAVSDDAHRTEDRRIPPRAGHYRPQLFAETVAPLL